MGPVNSDDATLQTSAGATLPTGGKLARRVRTIPLLFAMFLLILGLFLPLLLAVSIIDFLRWSARRTPWMGVRLLTFLLAYLTAETLGVIALGAISFVSERSLFQLTFAIQRRWAGFLFTATRTIFGITVTATGAEAVERPPFLLMARHTSIVDNLLHNHLISDRLGIHLRYVMKSELLIDPAIDIAGNRLPNAFVRRGSDDSHSAIEAVRRLTEQAGSDEGVLIYPEGTRFSRGKLERTMAVLASRDPDLHTKAQGLQHVLPPRLGGPLAMLDASTSDVVFMAHHGLEGFARVADIWTGSMVGRTISVEYWRVSRDQIPKERFQRVDWLYGWWHRIDDWVTNKERE